MSTTAMHAARARAVSEGKQALTPFAQAYFKLMRSKAGMGDIDEIETLEKAYERGEVTDAHLRQNAPKSWLAKLPKIAEASEAARLAVGDGVKVTKGSTGLGIEKGWGGKVKGITPGEGGTVKLEIFFRDGKTRVLWVRHMNWLSDAEFSANRGDPTKAVTLARIPAGQPVPGFVTAKKTESMTEASNTNPKVVPWDKAKSQFAVKFTTRKGETLWTGDGWKHSMDLGRDEEPALFPSEAAAKKAIEQDVLKYIAKWQPGYWQDFVKGWNPPAGVKIESGSFGFAEDLAVDVAMEKLMGLNFIDDGSLLEAEGTDPGARVRAQLAAMDANALAIRSGLNALVRDGIGMVEDAARVDLGEGTDTLASMKPVLGRLLTAYTELVAGLQKARESVGYDVEGPSVTTLPDESEMQERITRDFGQRKTRQYGRG